MPKRIQIALDGVTVRAVLNEEGAPTASARVWSALPIEETMRHVRWSGDAGYILVSTLHDANLPREDPISFYPPGVIAFLAEHGEVTFSYGQAQARGYGSATIGGWATHLGDLEGDTTAFLDKVRATLAEGGKRIEIRQIG